ncbi:MAG: hypothetical protein GX575_03865 [Candidatus Anammoximicrobium sp.]|nr:hypothetical protein [Candidatus Anammoximicrobium sp.]
MNLVNTGQRAFVVATAKSLILACGVCLLAAAGGDQGARQTPAEAQQPEPSETASGQLIRVPLPIAGEADTRLKAMIGELLARWQGTSGRPTLILEFGGGDESARRASQFERALSLARYLAGEQLGRVRTVAYLTGPVQGHAVLPVLACEQIVAHPDAELGRAGLAEDALDPTVRSGYVEIAERRRTVPPAVVLGMLDPQLAVSRVHTQDGARFVLSDELAELQKQSAVRSVEQVVPAGQLGNFTGTELRLKFGLASHLVRDRLQLASALQLPGGVEEDPTLAAGRRAVRVDLSGPIRSDTVNWVERGIREKIEQEQVNFICLVIDSPGGSPEDSMRLATYLSGLDPSQVRTVAFVASAARADAALIALACDQLLMTDTAVLGGPGARRIHSRKSEALRTAVRELAKAKSVGWSLPAAMIDADLSVQRYQRPGTGEVRYFCEPELAEQEHPQDWRAAGEIETRNGLRGNAAVELRLARFNVADWEDLKRTYHFEGELGIVQRNWAHAVVEFLASPRIAGMLLFAAWFTLMIEFSTPGLGFAGFASAVCFVLFFWANFLHGTAGWLEIVLFATGVVCLVLEIFVLPGVGAFGVGGGLLIVASILLASQTFLIPSNAYEWSQLPGSLFLLVATGAGAFAALVIARRLVTDAPLFRRVSLETPDEQQREQIRCQEALVHWEYLVGKRGVTVTQLTPSGKARFGDARVDVISDGEVIPYGTDVVVVEVRGNEVLVRALEIG